MKQTNKPFIIIIDGPMGAGKTTIAKLIHQKIHGIAHIGLDRTKFFVSHFNRTPEENAIAGAIVFEMYKTYLKNGVSVLLEQGFKHQKLLTPYLSFAKRMNFPIFIFQIEANPKLLLERLALRPKPEAAKRKVSKVRMIANIKSYFENKYQNAIIVSSENQSPEQIANHILKLIKKSQ